MKDLRQLRNSGRVQATHNSTKSWINIKVLELFRADVGYSKKIEEIDDKNILEDQLSKFILAMKKIDRTPYHASSIQNSFYLFNETLNGKLKTLTSKGLDEHNEADGLTLQEVRMILSHPSFQKTTPEGFSRHIFVYNSILLALRGGEHRTLKINNFLKRCDGGIDIQLFKSKTNQRGLDNPEAQAEVISLPNIKDIINDYEFYFTKRSTTTPANFYLKPCQVDNDAGLDFSHQHISNHSGRKTSVQVLKELDKNDESDQQNTTSQQHTTSDETILHNNHHNSNLTLATPPQLLLSTQSQISLPGLPLLLGQQSLISQYSQPRPFPSQHSQVTQQQTEPPISNSHESYLIDHNTTNHHHLQPNNQALFNSSNNVLDGHLDHMFLNLNNIHENLSGILNDYGILARRLNDAIQTINAIEIEQLWHWSQAPENGKGLQKKNIWSVDII
nr:7771_t:CDS:2 [Entrophospora candida]